MIYYCESCRQREAWPPSPGTSFGPCDLCGDITDCHQPHIPRHRARRFAIILTAVILLASLAGILLSHGTDDYDTCVHLHHTRCQPPPIIG